jgi:hypothetical protein
MKSEIFKVQKSWAPANHFEKDEHYLLNPMTSGFIQSADLEENDAGDSAGVHPKITELRRRQRSFALAADGPGQARRFAEREDR